MFKKINLLILLTIVLGLAFVVQTNVFAIDNFPGTCLDFDGTDDYVNCGNDSSLDIADEITLEVWVKPYSVSGNNRMLRKGIIELLYWDDAYEETTGKGFQVKLPGTDSEWVEFNYDFDFGQWYHVSWTYSSYAQQMKMYVNGQLDKEKAVTGSITTNTDSLLFAEIYEGERYKGLLEEIRLWDSVRTQTEIRENMYLPLSGTETGLVSYWQLNDGPGITAVDNAGSNNGTLINMTNDDWVDSTIPFGDGVSNTQIVSSTGAVTFTGTNVVMNFTEKTGTDTIVVTRLDTIPNIDPTGVETVFDAQYWIVNSFGSGSFKADWTLGISEDLTSTDQTTPGLIRLYHRDCTSDGQWNFYRMASSVQAAGDLAIFDDVSRTGQFIIARVTNASNIPGGDVSGTWAAQYSPYHIQGNITVPGGEILTIEQDVDVIFDGHYYFKINGRILAEGTSVDSIHFTADNHTDGWRGFVFYHNTSPDSSKFVYCTVDYGISGEEQFQGGGAFYILNSDFIRIDHCNISNNSSAGEGGAFYINNSDLIIIDHCNISNNSSALGAGFYCVASSPVIKNSTINNNMKSGGGCGGGLYLSECNLTLTNCLIESNSALVDGGGIYTDNSTISIIDCNISENWATDRGGGIFAYDNTQLTIAGSNIIGNSVLNNDYSTGGGIYFTHNSALTLTNSLINGNSAIWEGGGIKGYSSSFNVSNNTFQSNETETMSDQYKGGAIYSDGCSGTISNNTFYDNKSYEGGGIYVAGSGNILITNNTMYENEASRGAAISSTSDYATISLNTIRNNYAEENGGALYWNGSDADIYENIIKDNYADFFGGGIYLYNSSPAITNNKIFSNEVEDEFGGGGGCYFKNSSPTFIQNMVYENMANSECSGIFCDDSSVLSGTNNIITNNTVVSDGYEILCKNNSSITMQNSIIWNNSQSGYSAVSKDAGSSISFEYSCISGGYAGTGNTENDPLFVDSGNDLYIPQSTYCLNMAIADTTGLNLPENDITGNTRIYIHENSYNRLDMGVYEWQGMAGPQPIASDGNNNYPGYIHIEWEWNEDYLPAIEGFRLKRNNIELYYFNSTQTTYYDDHQVIAGNFYNYKVIGINGNEESNLYLSDTGYLKPNGIITGSIYTPNNNPVENVLVTIDPTNGKALEFDTADNVTIYDGVTDLTADFTLELWVKTTSTNCNLVTKKDNELAISNTGRIRFENYIQSNTAIMVNDNEWHHVAFVGNNTSGTAKIIIDTLIVGEFTGFNIVSDFGSNIKFGSDSFSGFMDDIRLWSTVRDSEDVVLNMNRIVSGNTPGLEGYWTFNTGSGDIAFDETNNSYLGDINGAEWTDINPGVAPGGLSDMLGQYQINAITYTQGGTTFNVIPYKSGHVFVPELRTVTLSPSNTNADNINFMDNSQIQVTGNVKYDNTSCFIQGAHILVNDEEAIPPIITDEDGNFVYDFEHGGDYYLSVSYCGHQFNRTWFLENLSVPQINIDFLDYDTDSLTVSVKGGPEDDFAIGSFEITIKTTNGNFGIIIDTTCTWSGIPSIPQSPDSLSAISITNNWQDDGSIIVAGLPPLEYNVSVDYRGNGIPAALDSLAQNPFDTQSVSIVDTTDTITFNWRAPMNINLAFSDTLQLQHFAADTVHTFYVLHQNEWAEIEVQVSEDYSCDGHPDQVTCLDDCALTILDEVGTTGETETAFEDTTIFTYIFAPYLPNMLSGYERQYQKKLEFTANDTDLNRFVTQAVWVLTEGVKPTESTYATTSPEIPIMILHDPPGDGSFSSFTQSSSHSIGFGTSVCTDSEHNIFANIHLGPDITIAVGTPFFSVESEIDITADFDLGLTMQKQQTQSMEHELTFSTSEEYTTSEEDQVIGDGADVFVGGAMNLIWGVTNELSWNDSAQTVIIDTCVMVTPDGFATVYIYTDNQIRNTVIPNLETIGDTLSAALWNTFLVNNENNKANAVLNPNHPDNLSFNAGAGYTYEEETSTTQTQTIEFESTVSLEFGAKIGMTVDGIGGEFGYTYRTSVTLGTSSNQSFETTSTTTFVLADDDETSDLNEIADYFSVNIKEDPVYGTPVFNLLSGATSCPWEPNTLAREGVSFSAESNSALNLPGGTIPAFILNLGNTSQTNEDRRYYLKLNNSSNPGGATIKINGVTIENMMQFDVPAGEAVQAVMTVEQGPVAYEYYDIELKFFSLEDENNPGPTGHYFEFVQLFDISWEPPYSQVQFDSPQDNWLINSANDDTMMITLSGYDITKPYFDCLKMQYKHPGEENWNPAFTIPYDTLLVNPYYIDYPWVVDNLTDGSYLIRAAAYDSIHAPYYTDNLTGLIDRQEPVVVGLPTPIDGILNVDDQISVSYTEPIDPNMLYLSTIIVTDLNTQDPVPFVAQAVDNQLIITLTVPNQYIENDILNVSVQNIYDLYGNCQTEETEWEMYVNRNPVGWNTGRIEVIKAIGTSLTISAVLSNSGGYTQSYVITDYPDSLYHPDLATHTPEWLSASPFEGQLVALDQQTIEFDISNQIGFGVYQVDLVANTSMGNEILEIEVNVLSNPPVWATNPIGNFDYSMTITGQLLIEGEISTDVNDIIGAFILNGTGEYECRGYASTKLVPYFQDVYQFYLTIHSDVDYGDDIIFRVWDASTNKEHYGIAEQYTFMAGAIYGTPVTPEIIHVSSNLIQTIQCNTGWSWISTNLLNAQSMAIDSVLSSLSTQQNDFIKNQTEYAQFTPGLGWVGTLDTLTTIEMYKIKLVEQDELLVIGALEDPVITSIPYGSGWNWIGYLPHISISVNEALADIGNLVTGDLVKNQTGFSQYIEGYGWFGSLLFMNPGDGYMLNTQDSGSFNYPDYVIEMLEPPNFKPNNNIIVMRNPAGWEVNPLNFEYSSNITAVIYQNGEIINSENILLGAFHNEECRGVAAPIEVLGQWMFFLTVYSNTLNDTITYKAYFSETEEIMMLNETTLFMNNQILGNPLDPFIFNITIGTLEAPQNLSISVETNDIILRWDKVTNANSYKVFASDSPDGTFIEVTDDGIFGTERDNTITWTVTIPIDNRKFYRVVASTETVRGSTFRSFPQRKSSPR